MKHALSQLRNSKLVCKKTFSVRRLLVPSILTVPIWVSALAALSFRAEAATAVTWDSNTGTSGAQDGSGTWNAGGATWWNGTADVATTSDLTTNIAQFGNGGTLTSGATVNVGTQSIDGLIFGTTTTTGYTLTNTGASTLTIGGGGITMNSTAQATTVGDSTNLSLALGAAQTWTNNNSGNLLTVGGSVANGSNLLTIAGVGAIYITGNIGNGSGGLTKNGTGTTILSGTNSYTGTTTVNAGTLEVGDGTSGSIASTSALALGGGTFTLLGTTTGTTSQTVASLTVNAGASAIVANPNGGSGTTLNVKAITRNVGGTIDFSGTGVVGTTTTTNTGGILGGYATFGGNTWAVAPSTSGGAITGLTTFTSDTWTTGNNTTVTLASNTAYNNVTTNSLRFNANAADTVTLSGTNVITTGGILVTSSVGSGNLSAITGGTLKGASGKDLVAIVNNTGGLSIGSVIADNGTATGLTVSGPGTLTLTGANTFTGATTVNGTLNLSNSLALQNSTPTVSSTGSLIFDSSVGTHAFTFGALSGIYNLSLTDNAVTPNAVALTVGGNNASTNYSGILSGSGSLIKTGTGNLQLTGVNTFTGGITVSNGILSNGGGGATSTVSLGTGPITVQSGGTLNLYDSRVSFPALTINGAGASGQPGALVGGGSASYETSSFASITLGSNSTIGAYAGGNGVGFGGPVSLGAFTLTLNPNAGAAASLSLPGIISGTGGLIQNGTGAGNYSILSGANTYTGATTVTAGTLMAGIATVGGAAPTSGAFGVNSTTSVNTGATLDLHGFSETLGSISGGGTITSSAAGTATLTIGGDNSSPTFAGVIQNGSATSVVAFTKIGSGTQTLAGANTYTGATNINGGTIQLANSAGLGFGGTRPVNSTSNTAAVASTGTLDLNGQTVTKPIVLNGGSLINSNVTTAAAVGTGLYEINFTNPGTGYTGGATSVSITGSGTGASANALLGVTTANFAITGGTTVYSVAPTVTITGGGGSGATATAILTAGVVSGITITNAGTGFTSAPTVAFSGGTVTTVGTNPTGTGNNTNFALVGVAMTSAGSGYTSNPSVSLSSGSGTTFSTTLGAVQLSATSSIGGAGDLTIASAISGTGGLSKIGGGTLTLSGSNSYSGATTVNAGTLIVSGSINGSTTTVNSGGTLAGTGTVSSALTTVNSGGTITAGATVGSIGTLNTGALTLNGTYNLTLDSTHNLADDLNVNGTLTLGGPLQVNDITPGAGGVNLTIAQYSSFIGTFTGLAQGASVDGGLYTINYGANAITLVAVPEPASIVSMLGGLGVLALIRRRRS